MTENSFDYDNIHVGDDGLVQESARIDIDSEYSVTCHVISYRFDDGKINHVPVAILTENGSIVFEATDNDTDNAEIAIERCKNTAEWLAENYERFI